jgi:tRNA(fMet)-specific endonuclease VapC
MLDTNICIHIRQHRPPQVRARLESLPPGSVVMSVITYGELMFGAYKSADTPAALRLLESIREIIPVLPMGEGVAMEYGAIRQQLGRAGMMIGNNDLWIAAHARSEMLTVVTNNTGEFSRVDGLGIEDWTK